MDVVGLGGLALSATGVALSGWALIKAGSAKKAVAKLIEMSGDQAARDGARDLMALLARASDAAMARRRGASRAASAGRPQGVDLFALEIAQDALATTTVASDPAVTGSFRAAAQELDLALKAIAADGVRDGWEDARLALQGVVPSVDLLQRDLGVKALR